MKRLAIGVLVLATAASCRPETAHATEGRELATAEAKSEERKRVRVETLRAEHAIIASQSTLISVMAQSFPLTDQGRAEINEQLTRFQMRLDVAKNLIESLAAADAGVWKERHDAVRDAMSKLEETRADAWKALEDAPKVDRRAS
jgi:hypothetical protein